MNMPLDNLDEKEESEELHSQQLTDWSNNLDEYHYIQPTHNED